MESSSRPGIRRKSSNLFNALSRPAHPSSSAPSVAPSSGDDGPPPPVPNSVGLEGLRATAQKRLTTWSYLRRVHESRAHWMNTYLFSREELEQALSKGQLGGLPIRTQRLTVLGMSLSSLLDVSNPVEFFRGLAALMSEFDNFDGETRPKTKSRIRTIKSRRSGSYGADADESYLMLPNLPFEFDYFQVFFSFCDVLVELWQKILLLVGGRPKSPRPPGTADLQSSSSSSTLDIKAVVTPAILEQLTKVDNKLKKLLTPINKELETLAREAIRRELSDLQVGMGSSTAGWDLED